jgi:hypothetical protein
MATAPPPLKQLPEAPLAAAYHLLVNVDEARITRRALNSLILEEAHETQIRRHARDVLAKLLPDLRTKNMLSVPLSAEEMKITHTALKLALDDSRREQHLERVLLRGLLAKLPDEHAIRAIRLV